MTKLDLSDVVCRDGKVPLTDEDWDIIAHRLGPVARRAWATEIDDWCDDAYYMLYLARERAKRDLERAVLPALALQQAD